MKLYDLFVISNFSKLDYSFSFLLIFSNRKMKLCIFIRERAVLRDIKSGFLESHKHSNTQTQTPHT